MLSDFFKNFFNKDENSSKNVAKKRLQFALMYDKLEVSDDTLENLQHDIVEVISRYFEVDKEGFTLDITKSDNLSALILKTPILAGKHRKPVSNTKQK